jgi:hypothetical protein
MPNVDAETLVRAIAVRLETESGFLSPQPATYITDPRGILRLVEDAGVSAEQIDQWIDDTRTKESK